MADAKSRYEIVQEITEKKQACLDQISGLEAGLVRNDAQLAKMQRDHARAMKELIEAQQQAEEDLKHSIATEKTNIGERKAMLERKVSAYEEAIVALKSISQGSDKTASN